MVLTGLFSRWRRVYVAASELFVIFTDPALASAATSTGGAAAFAALASAAASTGGAAALAGIAAASARGRFKGGLGRYC